MHAYRTSRGQAATEYLLITALLFAVLVAIDPNAIAQVYAAVASRFANLSFSVSLP